MAGLAEYVQIVTRAHPAAGTEPKTKSCSNVYVFRRTVVSGTPPKAPIAAAFVTAIQTPLKACLSVSYITDFIDTRFLDDPTDPYLTAALVANGTVSGDSLPSVNNATVRLRTPFRGRSNQGSKHFGPIAESSTTLDGLTSGAITLFQTFITAYLAGFTDANGFVWQPFLVSAINSHFSPTTAVVVGNNVTSATINPYLGIMRRRKE